MSLLNLQSPFNSLKDFDKFFVGFDDQYNRLVKLHDDLTRNVPNYPPYNIKKVEDNKYVIEIAVAGFGTQDIEIELLDNRLVVRGKTENEKELPDMFLFKGIASRAFTREFFLNDQIEVKDTELLNGMLRVFLEKIIPESKKPKKIPVNTKMSDKQYEELEKRLY